MSEPSYVPHRNRLFRLETHFVPGVAHVPGVPVLFIYIITYAIVRKYVVHAVQVVQTAFKVPRVGKDKRPYVVHTRYKSGSKV